MSYKQREDDEIIELPFFRQIKIIAFTSALFSTLLLIDYLLPSKTKKEIVIHRLYEKESSRFGGTNYNLRIKTKSFEIKADTDLFDSAKESTEIEIYYSPIFNFFQKVNGRRIDNQKFFQHKPIEPLFRGFASFPIALLFLGLFAYFYRGDETIAYVSGILSIIVLASMLMIF
jgi:hypothetical protein